MRCALFASILFGLVGSFVAAQDRKGIPFWNLTLYTIVTFQMSPAGKTSGVQTNARMIAMERSTTTSACESRASNLARCKARRQDRPRLHRQGCRGQGGCGLLN